MMFEVGNLYIDDVEVTALPRFRRSTIGWAAGATHPNAGRTAGPSTFARLLERKPSATVTPTAVPRADAKSKMSGLWI
jgi:hypothetical protein